MTRSRSSLILLALFLVQLFAGFGEARGLVWCFGAGGEVRLENPPQGRCGSADPCADEENGEKHAPGRAGHDLALDHCGDCLDLPALSPSFRHSPRFSPDADLYQALPPLLPVPPFLALPFLEEVREFYPRPPTESPHLVSLRTVVLRN